MFAASVQVGLQSRSSNAATVASCPAAAAQCSGVRPLLSGAWRWIPPTRASTFTTFAWPPAAAKWRQEFPFLSEPFTIAVDCDINSIWQHIGLPFCDAQCKALFLSTSTKSSLAPRLIRTCHPNKQTTSHHITEMGNNEKKNGNRKKRMQCLHVRYMSKACITICIQQEKEDEGRHEGTCRRSHENVIYKLYYIF